MLSANSLVGILFLQYNVDWEKFNVVLKNFCKVDYTSTKLKCMYETYAQTFTKSKLVKFLFYLTPNFLPIHVCLHT